MSLSFSGDGGGLGDGGGIVRSHRRGFLGGGGDGRGSAAR